MSSEDCSVFFFFFSSRRRHTRCSRDWSSDVCSSDLLERATVGEVLTKLADKTNYSTVRAQLRVLEEKGHVHHEEEGLRYVYIPCVPREVARRSALRHVVDTFFEGSKEKAVAALLGGEEW